MSLQQLINNIKIQASMATGAKVFVQIGTVQSYDPATYLIKVQIDEAVEGDEDTGIPAQQTGWINIMTPWAGNGWGLMCPPMPGTLIAVFYQDGSYQAPIGGLSIFNDINRALNVPGGEFWIVHKSGSFLKFTNDGNLSLNSAAALNIAVTGECKIVANTAIIDSSSIKLGDTNGIMYKLVKDVLIDAFNLHIHTDPQGGVTGTPTVPLNDAVLTQNVEAT